MFVRVLRSFVLVCLSLGLVGLFAACTSTTTDSSKTSSGTTMAISQRATPTISSTATSTNHTQSSTQTGSIPAGSTPIVPTSIVPTPTPLQPAPRATVAVKAPVPTPTPRSISTGPLTLVLACSGPNAQDGVSVTNTHAKACVYTSAGASLTITASFCNGKPDPNSALQGTFTANSNGFYEWDWTPQPSCRPISSWSVSVSAQLSGQSASVSQASSVG